MTTHAARSSRRLAGLGALTLALAATGSAPAQFGEAAGFGEMMSPYFYRRDLVLFVDGLELDEGQSAILESLYWDYEESHDASKARMLERLSTMKDKMKDLDRNEIMRLVFQPFEARSVEWEELRGQFLQNLQAILNSTQQEEWLEFRRKLRREKELPKGRFSGESVNLYHVLRDRSLDLDQPTLQNIAPLLHDYSVRLDQSLEWRERLMRDSRLAMMHAIRDDDPDSSLKIYDEQIDARIAIREANDEYLETVVQWLPDELGAEFRTLALRRGYPRVYRETAAQRVFNEAKALRTLSPEVLQAVVDLETMFLAELVSINESIRRLIKEYEPIEARFRAASFARRSRGERQTKPADPSRPEFRRREDVGRRYVEQLKGLLTDEQIAMINSMNRFNRAQANPAESDFSAKAAAKRRLKILPNQGRQPSITPDDD